MARRANGEGSIYQRKSDGRWAGSISLGAGNRKHLLGRTWAEVHEKMVAAQKAKQDGLPAVNERQTVKQFVTQWQSTTASSRKPRTNKRYEELLRLHVIPHVGGTALARLTPQQLQGLYARLEGKGLSPTTIRQVHAIVHKALKQGVAWGSLVRNPADHVDLPRVEVKETTVLSPAQVNAFLESTIGTRFEALFHLAVRTGMRQGELLGLRWRDVDLDEGIIQVRNAMQRIDGKFEFVEPKSKKSRRQIVLPESVVECLRRHRANQNSARLLMGREWHDLDLVFGNETGKPVEVSNLTNRYFRPLLQRAGLPRIRFHDLRHTAATTMLAANVNVKIVSEILGHSQTAFTMDRYQHVTESMQRGAMSAVDAILGHESLRHLQ